MRSLALPLFLAIVSWAFPAARSQSALSRRATDKPVIVQLFEWSWDSVASECTDFIGPAGYGYVQVSPAQEHVEGSSWWTAYQPVSYKLKSNRGDRSQFENMVKKCHSADVLVIADTLFNHMSGSDNGTGTGGSEYTHYDYPVYDKDDFHHCGLTDSDDIEDYTDKKQLQTCELTNLADLATDTEKVQSTLADYANDLLDLGVDGLRLDAAKHIDTQDIAAILKKVHGKPYITQEVIFGAGEPAGPADYVSNGEVQEYTTRIKEAFTSGSISDLKELDNQGWIAGVSANIFVSNHDTERNDGSLTYKSSSNAYVLAIIFSLGYPYGRPTVLSSFEFEGKDDGSPNDGKATCSKEGGEDGWLCQHRWPAFAGMVGFRNTVGSANLTDWTAPQGNQIAFGRESEGFLAINNAESEWSNDFSTSLKDGKYCDVIVGPSDDGACKGDTITVKDGKFSAKVSSHSALALHTGALSDD